MEATREFLDAAMAGDVTKIEHLLDREPQLVNARSERGQSAVLTAMYYGHPETAARLVERGAQLDIFDAAAVGVVERVKELLDEQPDLANSFAGDGFQPLGLASFFRQAEVARLLLERGAEVNSASQNPPRVMPLHSAAAAQDVEIARALLEHGAQVNAAQSGGFTPLHAAAQNGQVELIQLLLSYGADPRLANEQGQTPYDIAAESKHSQAAELLA